MRIHLRLFWISFLILFLELACIRWFGSTVIFLTFFTNIVLMACFLGMSLGCLSASGQRDFTPWVLPLILSTMILAYLSLSLYQSFSHITVDVGSQASPQHIFFGTEYRPKDPSQIVIPMEVVAGIFFALIALMFVGLGQMMGRVFDAIPDRLTAYTSNIAGSLGGIALFALASYWRTPPVVWFGISIVVIAYLRLKDIRIGIMEIVSAVGILILAITPDPTFRKGMKTFWSPYYKINYDPSSYEINTNNISHQTMCSVATAGPAYVLPHLLNRDAGGKPFQDVLIIGAGSGNDIQAVKIFTPRRIDAVEIDPVIQSLGQKNHPDRPYQASPVVPHLDDGRNFVKKTSQTYDLAIYALVDSLVLHSGYSSLRLESFLFTRQAFQDIKARLKPGGVFAMYNQYRQGWVVTRLVKLAEEIFGQKALVFSLPYQERISPHQSSNRYTLILCGDTEKIEKAFAHHKRFWINTLPLLNANLNGYGTKPPPLKSGSQKLAKKFQAHWVAIGPAQVDKNSPDLLPDDNWPFLYLHDRSIPALNVRGMFVMGLISLIFLLWLSREGKTQERSQRLDWRNFPWRMFLMGAGFMLLETKSVVHMALLFGSTWIVNSFVFASILLMILGANVYVITVKPKNLLWYYVLTIASLVLSALIPMETFLSLPGVGKILGSCFITFLPIFFSGIIFAICFRQSAMPHRDFGANVGGVILGGLCENFSLAFGFNGLLLIASAFYALSYVLKPSPGEASGTSVQKRSCPKGLIDP